MNDYISRQAALNVLCDNCDTVQAVCPHFPCKRYTSVETLPYVDVQPVRHGKWEQHIFDGIMGGRPRAWMCNQCNTLGLYKTDYCSNCGARMDGE